MRIQSEISEVEPSRRRTHRWHTREESEKAARPAGSKNSLDSSDVVFCVSTIYSTEGKGGGDDRDEHEERNSHGSLVEVDHLFNPVGTNRRLKILNESTTPWLSGVFR